MKKLFFAICFSFLFVAISQAKITPVSGFEKIPQPTQNKEEPAVRDVSMSEFKEMLKKGFTEAREVDKANIDRNVSYIPSQVHRQKEEEKKKSFFQKVYEQAINRVSAPKNTARNDVVDIIPAKEFTIEKQQENWNEEGIPTITAYLPPNNTPFSVPALEHIPYLMSSIEVLPSGLVKFEDTVSVIANGNRLNKGLTKILPLRVFNAEGKSQKLDYSILNVQVNDLPVSYKLVSNGKNALMVPTKDYPLTPGIYTYKFEYVVDNLLWDYGAFYQLYWDVAGNGWNLVVDRLGASLNLPLQGTLVDHNVLLGSPSNLSSGAVYTQPNGLTATAYIAARPLFIGEGMHLIANISKAAFITETIWQKIIRNFYSYGDIYLSILGLIIITVSMIISGLYISKNKGQLKISLSKTPMLIRYLLFNRFDIKSVCGFLLDLYKKNIIDIQQAGETILLIKRTDNLKSLTSNEQKALKQIFPAHETVFNVNKQNILPIKRFSSILGRGLWKQMFSFNLKLNSGYLLLSSLILFFVEAAVSAFSLNSLYVFKIVSLTTILCFIAILSFLIGKKIWVKIFIRFVSIIIIAISIVLYSAVISPIAAIFLILSMIVITTALSIYSRRLGLLKQYIQDMGEFKDYLLKNHDNIVLGKNFLNYQSVIWAFDLENDFVPVANPEYNKLPIVENIAKIWSST